MNRRAWVGLLIAGTALAGCTAVPGVPGAGAPAGPGAGPSASEVPADCAGAYPAGPTFGRRAPLACRTAQIPIVSQRRDLPVAVEVTELRTSGELMQLTVSARNLLPAAADPTTWNTTDSWQVSTFFSSSELTAVGNPAFEADGIHLVDESGGKRYLPGRTELDCACDQALSARFVPAGDPTEVTAFFAAPPPGVDRLGVFLPGVGLIPDIPVTRGPGGGAAGPVRAPFGASGGKHVDGTVELAGVHRAGDLLTVTATARNDSPQDWYIGSSFNNGEPRTSGISGLNFFDGVEVYDAGAARRYRVGYVDGDTCACSGDLHLKAVPAGGSVALTAVLAAPPADVTAVDVRIPMAGTFHDVPIVDGGAAEIPPGTEVLVPPAGTPTDLPVEDIAFPEASADGKVVDKADGDFTLSADVLFAFDEADLTDRAHTELARIADKMRAAGVRSAEVIGYTDDVGDTGYNQQLSRDRAEAVRAELAGLLGSAVTLTASGRGESNPVADNATEDGRAQNRRVEIEVG